MKPRILICSGGTGGHMFPANVLSLQLLKEGYDVEIISDKRGAQYLTKTIRTKALNLNALGDRKLLTLPIAFLQMLVLSIVTFITLLSFRPNLIIGFGGYITFPALWMARILRIPFSLHEQNSVMGRVNRKFAPYANVVMTSFPQTLHASGNIKYTGLPVRAEFIKSREVLYTEPQEQLNILVLGGSQGASIFSKVIPDSLQHLPEEIRKRIHIVQQCRNEDIEKVRAQYRQFSVSFRLASFITNVAEEIAKAHIVITRAGASTLSEVTVAGRPALYIPYPAAMDDHQTYNAIQVVEAGGGWMVAQDLFTAEYLRDFLVEKFEQAGVLSKAAKAAYEFGKHDALKMMMNQIQSNQPIKSLKPSRV